MKDLKFEVMNFDHNETDLNSTNPSRECSLEDMNRKGVWRSLVPLNMSSKWMLDQGDVQLSAEQVTLVEFAPGKLIFQPQHCTINDVKQTEQCIDATNGQELCFVGDSQMRHLAGEVAAALEHMKIKFDNNNHKTDKKVYLSAKSHLIIDNWGSMEFSPAEHSQLSNCSVIVVDVGQWQLSWAMINQRKEPFRLQEYADLVQRILRKYTELFTAKLFFVGSMPFGQNHRIYFPVGEPGKDYRTDIILREFNIVAMDACHQVIGANCLNLFEIGDVLRDLSYDLAHFRAPVGSQSALALLSGICNQ